MRYRGTADEGELDLARWWVRLGVLSIGGYAVLQGYALTRGTQSRGTLSYHLRAVLGIHPRTRYTPMARAAWVAGCAWLAYHIAIGTEHGRLPLETRRSLGCCATHRVRT